MRTDGLRPMVEAVEREMSRLVSGGADGADVSELRASWARLVEFLALGPAPEQRECPFCGAVGVRAATRCGYCWSRLTPPTPLATA